MQGAGMQEEGAAERGALAVYGMLPLYRYIRGERE